MEKFKENDNTSFFCRMEEKNFISSSAILWNRNTTRTIDLSVMMENETDSKNTRLSELPNSLSLSVQRESVKLGPDNKDPNLVRVSMK